MSGPINLTGQKFGMLYAVKCVGKNKWGNLVWLCKCDCGKEKLLSSGELRKGIVKSCGCAKNKLISNSKIKHNMSDTRFYKIWESMKRRCDNCKDNKFNRYGGRGIIYQNSWKEFKSFKIDMYADYLIHVFKFGEKNTTLDRKNVDGNYTKSNCKWSTAKEQQNNRSNNTTITIGNEILTISEAANKFKILQSTLSYRIRKGWDINKAICPPLKK
jgi:hypothetical protein